MSVDLAGKKLRGGVKTHSLLVLTPYPCKDAAHVQRCGGGGASFI